MSNPITNKMKTWPEKIGKYDQMIITITIIIMHLGMEKN